MRASRGAKNSPKILTNELLTTQASVRLQTINNTRSPYDIRTHKKPATSAQDIRKKGKMKSRNSLTTLSSMSVSDIKCLMGFFWCFSVFMSITSVPGSERLQRIAAWERCHLAVDGPPGIMRVADRDTIVERHKEGIGVTFKRQISQSCMLNAW